MVISRNLIFRLHSVHYRAHLQEADKDQLDSWHRIQVIVQELSGVMSKQINRGRAEI